MDHEPNEIIVNILGFVPDKIYVSMVCKRWNKLLDDMYVNNIISNNNDPYYLKSFHKVNGVILFKTICVQIESIVNHKCLHYLHNLLCVDKKPTIMSVYVCFNLLLKNCEINNISNTDDILNLIENVSYPLFPIINCSSNTQDIYHTIFKNKSYDILILVADKVVGFIFWWLNYHQNTTKINILIKEIEIFVDKKIITLSDIYKQVCHWKISLKTELMIYLEIQMAKKLNS